MDKIYVVGHKNPDTDTVTSSISLSYLKYKLGINAEPRVLGNVNAETLYALNKFKIKVPLYLNDVKLQVKDINYNKDFIISEDAPIIDAFNFMHENGITGIPLVDKDKKFKGYVSLKEIASDMINNNSLTLDTSFKNLVEVLAAKKYYKVDDNICGTTCVSTFDDATLIKDMNLDNNSIVIVGNRKQVIEHAIKQGVKLIILVNNVELSDEQLSKAKEKHVNVITSSKSSFKVARVLCLCNPIKSIQRPETCITFNNNDYITDVEDKISKLKHTNYPIINNEDVCLGMLRTMDIKKVNRKKVILVDHNQVSQAVDGLNEAEILEIVDHHNLGDIVTSKPISIRTMTVGATNTIIYHLYKENNITIPKDIAGIMLSGILSDTLGLSSPTTTDEDKKVVEILSRIAGVDYKTYGLELLESGVSIKGLKPEDIIFKDNKEYSIGDHKFSISQVFTTDFKIYKPIIKDLVDELNQESKRHGYDVCALYVTDFINNTSYIIYSDNSKNILEIAYGIDNLEQGYKLDNIVSRKQQIIPIIMDVLGN